MGLDELVIIKSDPDKDKVIIMKSNYFNGNFTIEFGEEGILRAGKWMSDQLVETTFKDIPFSSAHPVRVSIILLAETCADQITVTALPSSHCPIGEENIVQSTHEKFLKNNLLDKPSATAIPSTFCEQQVKITQAIPYGCPYIYKDCIPTILLHPIFGQFIEDTRNIPLTVEDNKLAMDLVGTMSAFYSNEFSWIKKIQGVLETYNVHFYIIKIKTTGYKADGNISTQGYRYVIAEFKNKTGNTSTRSNAPKMLNSPLLCLLLSIFTIQILKQYYNALQPPQSLSSMSSPQLFPYCSTYTSWITKPKTKQIVYLRQLSKDKLFFFSFEDTYHRHWICIKFVQWYSPVSLTTKELIAEKLAKFHEAGFVHGYIRDMNIMIFKLNQKDFKIVDFDWAGRANEVTYPPCVNREI
ncbi:hypothetical protein HD554DRAFT_2201417 [Boletus coccyginus]|nr:hypothetical protein HD554DRAFT_2201417 [Boletus coccyginus]